MRKIRQMLAAATMMTVLLFGTTFAGDGIIVFGAADSEPCTAQQKENVDHGIIVFGFTGIIVFGLTGIIVFGAAEEAPTTDCGIIVFG